MKKTRAILLASLAVLAAVGGPVVGSVAAADDPGLDIEGSEQTPNPRLKADAMKAVHDMNGSILDYEDDNGNAATLNGSVANTTNPITLNAENIAVDSSATYPTENESTLDPDDYALSGNTSKVNLTAASGDTPGLRVDADNMAAGDSATANFSNLSITSDIGKRVLWTSVSPAELNGTLTIRVNDAADSDYKEVVLNSSRSVSDDDVAAGSAGMSAVSQPKLMDLATEGSGDGSISEIGSLEIIVSGGDVDVSINTLRLDRLSQVKYGAYNDDVDSDGTLEAVDIYEPTGDYNVSSLDTLASVFNDATVYDVSFAYTKSSADVGDVAYEFNKEAAEDYQRQYVFQMYSRLSLVDTSDVEFDNARAVDTVAFPTGRLVDAWYVEGAGGSSFEDLSSSSAQISRVQAFETAGDGNDVTYDDSITPGTTYVFYQSWTTDSDDKSAMTMSGGPGGLLGGGDVGLLQKYIFNPISGAIGLVLALFGLNKSGDNQTEG